MTTRYALVEFPARGVFDLATRAEEIERLAALALAPLVEVAWADGAVTAGERQAVLDAAKALGLRQHSEFCRSTLMRWLHEEPPSEALDAWRRLLAPTLEKSTSRSARQSERELFDAARRIAKMDERPFDEGASVDARTGITAAEQNVLDELAAALARIDESAD